jgi:ubiquitin-protein ligase
LSKAELIKKNIHSDFDETRLHTPDHVVQFTARDRDIATWKQTILYPASHKTITVLYSFTIKCPTTVFLAGLVL